MASLFAAASAQSLYTKDKKVGEGTYAVVYLGKHVLTGRKIAIKKIKLGEFKDGLDLSAVREIKSLQEIRHPNVIELIDVYMHNQNLNLVLEFLPADLEMVIKNKSVAFSAADIKSWMLMMLEGINHIHRCFIVHRDIKPNNMLISEDGILKIADFGLARDFGGTEKMSPNVVTRWYRAPELFLGARHYGGAVDMWAIGCIFAELMLRLPYMAAETEIGQLDKIFQALGSPTDEDWPGMKLLPLGSTIPITVYPRPHLPSLFTAASQDALDLLESMLRYDPLKRLTPREALGHRYFKVSPAPTHPSKLPKDPSPPVNELKRKWDDDAGKISISKKLFGGKPNENGQIQYHSTSFVINLYMALFTVNPHFHDEIAAVASNKAKSAEFWISAYNYNGVKSIHSTVSVSLSNSKIILHSPDFTLEYIDEHSFCVIINESERIKIQSNKSTTKLTTTSNPPNCFSLSPSENLLVVGGDSGELNIYDVDGSLRRKLEGHVSDISTAKFFPSGQVILSAGLDFRIKVWGLDGVCPVTMVGHTAGINDLAIISRGRNILSCSRDGTVKLWETKSGECIHTVKFDGRVNKICLGTRDRLSFNFGDSKIDPREVETEGKVVFGVTSIGLLFGVDLSSKTIFLEKQVCDGGLCCVDFDGVDKVVVGSEDGGVFVFDLNDIKEPVWYTKRNEAVITNVRFWKTDISQFIITTGDGVCTRFKIGEKNAQCEYVGCDLESICGVEFMDRDGFLCTLSKDGCLRKFPI